MKKLLILSGLLFLNSTLFSMEKEQDHTKLISQKKQLSRWEKVKVGGAIFGCSLFTWATLFNYTTRQIEKIDPKDKEPLSIYHYPTVITVLPLAIINAIYSRYQGTQLMSADAGYNIGAAYSSILAILCGRYAYKKLTQSKKDPVTKA